MRVGHQAVRLLDKQLVDKRFVRQSATQALFKKFSMQAQAGQGLDLRLCLELIASNAEHIWPCTWYSSCCIFPETDLCQACACITWLCSCSFSTAFVRANAAHTMLRHPGDAKPMVGQLNNLAHPAAVLVHGHCLS